MQYVFGNNTNFWFDDVALKVNDEVEYDPDTVTIADRLELDQQEEDEFRLAGISCAFMQRSRSEGKTVDEIIAAAEEDGISIDSNTSNLEKWENLNNTDLQLAETNNEEFTFDLSKMINLRPPLKVGPQNEEETLALWKTGASGFTTKSQIRMNISSK